MVDKGIGIAKVDQVNNFSIFESVKNRDNMDGVRVVLGWIHWNE